MAKVTKATKGAIKAAAKKITANKIVAARKKKKLPLLPAFAPMLPAPRVVGSGVEVLDRLWDTILARRDADPALSHSARLLSRGSAKVAQKFGEEAVECLIEAATGNREALVAESADVLYHLLVMWVDRAVRPEEVWSELARREGVSGIVERASRAKIAPLARRLGTTKIP
jgi:phosphoribosyl-ATP pyrophosphohydrolase